MRFLAVMIIVYLILAFLSPSLFLQVVKYLYTLALRLVPVFVLVILLMAVVNYVASPDFIRRHLGKGLRGWFFAIVGGILSTGPIYMWYPLLADLKRKGMSWGKIATFLYNRAVKIPLIPLMVTYFGWKYTVVLTLVMVGASVVVGVLTDLLMKEVRT